VQSRGLGATDGILLQKMVHVGCLQTSITVPKL
jgi:hypothetical protein